jgi:hypothetical protein
MLEEPAAENLHGGIREGGDRLESWPTYTRTQLETADRSQGTPTIQGGLLYSESMSSGEPGAGNLHAGFYLGRREQEAMPTR